MNYKKIDKNVYFLPKPKQKPVCFYQIFVHWISIFCMTTPIYYNFWVTIDLAMLYRVFYLYICGIRYIP